MLFENGGLGMSYFTARVPVTGTKHGSIDWRPLRPRAESPPKVTQSQPNLLSSSCDFFAGGPSNHPGIDFDCESLRARSLPLTPSTHSVCSTLAPVCEVDETDAEATLIEPEDAEPVVAEANKPDRGCFDLGAWLRWLTCGLCCVQRRE